MNDGRNIAAMFRTLAQKMGLLPDSFPGGIHPEMHKLSADSAIEVVDLPPLLILPMNQHIGTPCSALVSVGERVLRGQKIAKSEGYLSVPVHASTSGRVVKIEESPIAHPSGMGMPSVFIEADGDDQPDDSLPPITDWQSTDPTILRERARMCGLAGLGGAAFPTFIKLVQDKRFPIDTVILNGIECEPYLTNDHRLMVERASEIIDGMAIIMHMVGTSSGIIAIEDNKADAAEAMQLALADKQGMDDVRVEVLPTRYPQGSEKQLIYSLTGHEVPGGKLPMHVGVLCQNVGTSKALHDAIVLGRPLTERIVTLSGDALPKPANLSVRLGTPIRSLFERQGLDDFTGIQIVHGGPMMGERLRHPDIPVIKSTSGILALGRNAMAAAHSAEDPCIRRPRWYPICWQTFAAAIKPKKPRVISCSIASNAVAAPMSVLQTSPWCITFVTAKGRYPWVGVNRFLPKHRASARKGAMNACNANKPKRQRAVPACAGHMRQSRKPHRT